MPKIHVITLIHLHLPLTKSIYIPTYCYVQQLLSVAYWLGRPTGITEPQIRVRPEGLQLNFYNCHQFDFKIVYKFLLNTTSRSIQF